LAQLQPAINAVVRRAHARSILGRLQGYRSVPFNVAGAFQTSGATYAWIGEGAPKNVGNLQYTAASLTIAKAAGIIVLSAELARLSDSDVAMRDDIERGLAEFLDQQFIDPTVVATTANPGSILNTAPSIGSAGT